MAHWFAACGLMIRLYEGQDAEFRTAAPKLWNELEQFLSPMCGTMLPLCLH